MFDDRAVDDQREVGHGCDLGAKSKADVGLVRFARRQGEGRAGLLSIDFDE